MLGQADRSGVLIFRGVDDADARHRYRLGTDVFASFFKKKRLFFFEKKNQKTFISFLKPPPCPERRSAGR
jgi:hypothetical protein